MSLHTFFLAFLLLQTVCEGKAFFFLIAHELYIICAFMKKKLLLSSFISFHHLSWASRAFSQQVFKTGGVYNYIFGDHINSL